MWDFIKNVAWLPLFPIHCSSTVLKTGLPIMLACNIPKNSPMLEVCIEHLLLHFHLKEKSSTHAFIFLKWLSLFSLLFSVSNTIGSCREGAGAQINQSRLYKAQTTRIIFLAASYSNLSCRRCGFYSYVPKIHNNSADKCSTWYVFQNHRIHSSLRECCPES